MMAQVLCIDLFGRCIILISPKGKVYIWKKMKYSKKDGGMKIVGFKG
jgi:hypothetical protein